MSEFGSSPQELIAAALRDEEMSRALDRASEVLAWNTYHAASDAYHGACGQDGAQRIAKLNAATAATLGVQDSYNATLNALRIDTLTKGWR